MRNLDSQKERSYIGHLILTGLLLCVGTVAFAQDKPINKEQPKQEEPLSGALIFKDYCAVCHGKDAKGHGPAAPALKQRPADLTTLAKRNGGAFPDTYVSNVLRNGVRATAHGDSEMPVWGPQFKSMDKEPLFMYVRISGVISYIKSLQVK